MIINGGSRRNGAFFARHLMRADDNERVTVAEMRGFTHAGDVREAFSELRDLASGTRCQNYFYHANLNTRADETLSPEDWTIATDRLEAELQLTGQPRFVVEHTKEGRVHRHVVWGRVDAESLTAIPDSHNYRTHELVAAELETRFGHQATERALTRDKEVEPRPEPRAKDWETFRAQASKIDPAAMKAELTELWQRADTGQAFAAALAEQGYILARGDMRDFCVVDEAGDEHSLARRIAGVKATGIRERMADVDASALPSVAEARELARQRWEDADSGGGDTVPLQERALQPEAARENAPSSRFDQVMAETIQLARLSLYGPETGTAAPEAATEMSDPACSKFDQVMAETKRLAAREATEEAARPQDERRKDSWDMWLGNVRRHLGHMRETLLAWWREYFGLEEQDNPQRGYER